MLAYLFNTVPPQNVLWVLEGFSRSFVNNSGYWGVLNCLHWYWNLLVVCHGHVHKNVPYFLTPLFKKFHLPFLLFSSVCAQMRRPLEL